MKRTWVVVAFLFVAFDAAAGVAGLVVRRATVSIPSGNGGVATARCPRGSRPSFGGLTATLAENGPEVDASGLARAGGAVRASATNVGRPGKATLTVFAYCGHGPAVTQVSASTMLATREQGSVTATCPAGTSVAFGGFRSDISLGPAPPQILVDGLERLTARTWRVSGLDDGTGAGQLTALAYCARRSVRMTRVTASAQVPSGETKAVTARCPRGKTVALGGFTSQHYTAGNGSIYLSSMKRTSARTWTVAGHKFVPRVGRLTAIAYCR